jgi:8-oxo-dGTP diphosphatase
MERGPVLVVAACIVRGETVLLARRNQPDVPEAHLKWELPGGKVRLGETPQEAVRREIQEELGTTINVVRLLPHLQTNLYHRSDGTIGHFLVVAFESVLAKGATQPEPTDESVKQFQWVSRQEVKTLSLLPGTDRFIECLQRMDRASFDEAHLYVRLEKRDKGGASVDYWEYQCIIDLWGEYNLLERHVNLKRRSTQSKVLTEVSQANLWERLTARVRDLAQQGYVVSRSTTTLLEPLGHGA